MKEDIPVLDFSGKTPSGIVKKPTIILEGETAAETDNATSGSVRTWQKLEPVGRTFPEALKAEENVVSAPVEITEKRLRQSRRLSPKSLC